MPKLKYLLSKKYDESYTINWYDGPQEISERGYKFTSEEIFGLVDMKNFSDVVYGTTSKSYFKKYVKYKYNDVWSDMIPIEDILSGYIFSCPNSTDDTILLDQNNPIIIEIYYFIAHDSASTPILSVDNIKLGGEYMMNASDSEAYLPNKGDEMILAPTDIYKIFGLDGFEVLSNNNFYDIKYRFTQDNNRTFTAWTPLTIANIKTTKLNPLRFAKVEYLIKSTGDEALMVYDIILDGDFQNVSANSLKSNKYGLKEDCIASLSDTESANNDFVSECSTYNSDTAAADLNSENISKTGTFWNPYDYQKVTDFSNLLGNQVMEIFGWNVDYHLVDPDGYGQDIYAHENTLKNIVDMKKIKAIIPDNKFPVESLVVNQFNLDLFDTFEIHIMKDEFKSKFGVDRRPAQDDILYICEANMLYYIKHSQAFKDVMNAATYYKIVLEKFEDRVDMRNLSTDSKSQIDILTENTTLDSLFGDEMKEQENKIANKTQQKPTSMDFIRHKISKYVDYNNDEELIIDDFAPVTSSYILSNPLIKNKVAIDYKISDSLLESSNRSFMFWFKIDNEYDEDSRILNKVFDSYSVPSKTVFHLLTNSSKKVGYDITYRGTKLILTLNGIQYKLNKQLLTNIWYVGVINLDQKQRELSMNLYQRNGLINVIYINPDSQQRALIDISDTDKVTEIEGLGFKPVSNSQDEKSNDINKIASSIYEIEPIEFSIKSNLTLKGSALTYSNLRIFSDVIPEDSIKNIIKENIVKESQYLILADNATKKIKATNFYNKNWK